MIGVFGGSFDPPHKGHLNIIKNFINKFNSKILVIPNYLSPFKKMKSAGTFHILRMLEIMKKEYGLEFMEVSDIELKRGGLSFTFVTLEELNSQNPEEELYLLLGEDNLSSLHKWMNIERIFSLAKVLVYQRPGIEGRIIPDELISFKDKIYFQNNEENPASSTRIRSEKYESDLSPSVLQYILENGLYGYTREN